jgi:hypothetical protein
MDVADGAGANMTEPLLRDGKGGEVVHAAPAAGGGDDSGTGTCSLYAQSPERTGAASTAASVHTGAGSAGGSAQATAGSSIAAPLVSRDTRTSSCSTAARGGGKQQKSSFFLCCMRPPHTVDKVDDEDSDNAQQESSASGVSRACSCNRSASCMARCDRAMHCFIAHLLTYPICSHAHMLTCSREDSGHLLSRMSCVVRRLPVCSAGS